jgi:chromosome partitioning protein
MVREARRQRRIVDARHTDWIVVRNRLSVLGSRNKRLVGEGLGELSARLGFRFVDGFAERVVYREFFPRGLTALDDINEDTLGMRPTLSHVTARDEVKTLIDNLKLPIDERGKRRVAARAEWAAASAKPFETHDLFAD